MDELSEEELFNDAVADEPAEAVAEAPVPEQEEVARDEAGRFAAKEEPKEEVIAEVEAKEPEKPAVDDSAPQVPSWRVREIREERDELRRKLEEALSRPAQPKQEAQPAAKVEKPDPLLDPEGYEKYLETKFETTRLNDRRDMDLELTRQANADAFDAAHNEAMRLKSAGDPAFAELAQKMQSTDKPGKVLLKWHQERSMKAEIGDDLTAYKQRLREELLKDPEFLTKATEAARSIAQPSNNGRPRVELPPTLNGASRSNAMLRSAATNDVSDEELFHATTG